MSLHRTTRLLLRPTVSTTALPIHSRFASSNQQPAQNVEGASGKNTQKAQPKILSESPPEESEQSEEVRKHNEEMSRRADRAGAQVSREDIENDKVHKGFWSGDKTKGGIAGGSS